MADQDSYDAIYGTADPAGDNTHEAVPFAGSSNYETNMTPGVPVRPILKTSYKSVPTSTSPGEVHDSQDDAPTRIREAVSDYWNQGGPITPEYQQKMNTAPEPFGWVNRNIVNPALKIPGAIGTAAGATVNELASDAGVPPKLTRDLNLAAQVAPAAGMELPTPIVYGPQMQALSSPVTPSLYDVWQQQRAKARASAGPDPVADAAATLLRNSTGQPTPTNIPSPPSPFKGAPYQPPAPPSVGLLGIPPAPPGGPAPIMSTDEMHARSQGYYSPADKQAAAGVSINPDAADGIRAPLTSQVPTDPQKAVAIGNTPLVQLGKEYGAFDGQPMTYDAAMALDRRLTAEGRAAARDNPDLARQIGDVQNQVRDNMQSLGENDTTGDATSLANLPQARQAYSQYVKSSQVDDVLYRASLRPEDKQDAYARGQFRTMLGNDSTMRNWSPDEQAALEDAVQSGNVGTFKNIGLGLVKPFGKAMGGMAGSPFGVPGAIVGSQIGGDLGETLEGKLRAALTNLRLDPVRQALSNNMPPPPVPSIPQPPASSGPYPRQYVDPTKPFTYDPPSTGWPAGTATWANRRP